MQSYKELIVWQKSRKLVKLAYQVTEPFPKGELFGLTSQIRRAAVSIPANLAEGYTRKHRKEYIQFVRVAYASGAELETLFVLSSDLGFIKLAELEEIQALLDEIMRMLNKLVSTLMAKP